MNAVYDLSQITLALKSDEKVIAFTGFTIRQEPQPAGEGVLKISSFTRTDWSGYLTLTFIIDTDSAPSIRDSLSGVFAGINETTVRRFFTGPFETVLRCPMDSLSKSGKWYFEEINIYFKALKGKERAITEQQLLPALEKMLPFRFEPVEWWDQHPLKPQSVHRTEAPATTSSLKDSILNWFRSL